MWEGQANSAASGDNLFLVGSPEQDDPWRSAATIHPPSPIRISVIPYRDSSLTVVRCFGAKALAPAHIAERGIDATPSARHVP